VRLFDEVGISLAPTFVAFTPWITLDGYLDLLNVIAELGLIRSVASVQLTIRLLIRRARGCSSSRRFVPRGRTWMSGVSLSVVEPGPKGRQAPYAG